MKFLKGLENNLLTSLIVYAVSVLGFVVTSFLLNSRYEDVPLGFIFSGGVIGSTYLLTHFLIKIDEKNGNKGIWSIVSLIARFVIIVTVMVLLGLMNYRWNIVIFNLFVFVGVYTAGVIVFALLHVFNKDRKETDA